MKRPKIKKRLTGAFSKLSRFIKKYSAIGISESIENILELFFEGIRNSSNAFWYLFLAVLVFPLIVFLLIILTIKKTITNFFEYIANFLKSFYRVINYFYRVVKDVLTKIYNIIKTWFIVAIGEIKFYFSKIETTSKKLKHAWEAILIFFWDYLNYLAKKILNDRETFTNKPDDGYIKLLSNAIIAPIVWTFWIFISLPMILLIAISSILVFPPLLHRAIRVGISTNSHEVLSFSADSFDIESIGLVDLTVEQPPESDHKSIERPVFKDFINTTIGILILTAIGYIYINNTDIIAKTRDNIAEWLRLPSHGPINVDDFIIKSGGFENQGTIAWSQEPSDSPNLFYGAVTIQENLEEPFEGQGMAVLYNQNSGATTIYQHIAVPDIWNPRLRFRYKVISNESTCSESFVTVTSETFNSSGVKKTKLWSKELCNDSFLGEWELQSISLRRYRGSEIKLSFTIETIDSYMNSFFLLDEVNFDLDKLRQKD